MKKFMKSFCRKGLTACGLGPIVLVVLYLILQQNRDLQTLTVNEVCVGILSLSVLAFVAGGMNAVYKIERMPLMVAILLHGSVLYISYLATYLVNGWLDWGMAPILVFSGIFILGYLIIWAIIYSLTKKSTEKLNEILKQNQLRKEGK